MEKLLASHGVLVLRLGTLSGVKARELQTCDNFGDSDTGSMGIAGWHNPASGRAGAPVRHAGNAHCHPSC